MRIAGPPHEIVVTAAAADALREHGNGDVLRPLPRPPSRALPDANLAETKG